MTNKVELNRLTQVVHKEQAFLTALNENFLRLQQAINDTLSRSGVAPNEMEEVLDMNGKRVINVGAAVEDTDALTRGFINDLIASVEAAVARLDSLVADAKTELALYAATNILPPAEHARDEAIAAKNAAKEYYDDTKALYDQLASLVQNLNALLAISEHLGDIVTVKENLSNINEVAAISEAITTCSNNITAILAAPIYADHAETWAEGTDEEVAVLGGTHSAKVWAQLVAQGYVPVTRTINGKALSNDIVLTAQDVGAATAAQGAKADTAVQPGDLATVATTGDYDDLLNKPTIPDLEDAIKSSQITIATTDWSGNTCTKSVSGVTATSDVFVSPEPVLANIKAYTEANVFCSAISAGTVTFTCETTPSVSLTVNIGVN